MRKFLLASALAFSVSACADAGADPTDVNVDLTDKEAIEQIVYDYLLENPQILREMSAALRIQDEAEERALTNEVIAGLSDRILDDPRDIKIGPEDAKVTVVEFFDYNCSFCKTSSEWLRETIEKHPDDVRVVFKEVPVLDRGRPEGSSRNAARAALAAGNQGQYPRLHFSLMNERALTPERIEAMMEAAGLDMEKFRKDVKNPDFDIHINQNLRLAKEIPAMTGTPFFIINGEYVSGAKVDVLQDILERELEG